MLFALILFAIMYVLLLRFPKHRHWISLGTAALFLLLRILPLVSVPAAVNWNVLLMLSGTMILVSLFIESGMPARMSEDLLLHVPNAQWAVVALSLFSGIISAFVDNVATVLMVAPIGMALSRKMKLNPVPVIIAISVSSNLQGAATLVGDTTSMLLGAYAGMGFNDFFYFHGRPGICLAVELGALATVPLLLFIFRHETGKLPLGDRTPVQDIMPTVFLFGMVFALIFASRFEEKPELTVGMLSMGFALLAVLYEAVRQRKAAVFQKVLREIDYETLFLLLGLFIVIQGITEAGVIDAVSHLFVRLGGGNVFLMYAMIVGVSVLLSAFIDNIPYVATMLPVVTGIAAAMGIEPYLFDFGLLIGATLGGNLTPVGASANIAGLGILRKEGYQAGTGDFMRIGLPFTLTAVLVGAVTVWICWA